MKKLLIILCLFITTTTFAGWREAPGQNAMLGAWRPAGLFPVGHEAYGATFYLCRARVDGSWQPGKTKAGYPHCNVPFAGRELIRNRYEVFYGKPRGYWLRDDGRPLPTGAMAVGRDVNGNTLYLCQAPYGGGMVPGKTWPGYRQCNIPYGGREVVTQDYAVYVLGGHRPWHRHHHHYYPHHHWPAKECVSNPFGHQVCGYHCVKSMMNMKCASRPDQTCASDQMGHIACGYNCASSMNSVACASSPRDNCVSDPFGNVRCGYHCRVDRFNQIRCG